MANIPAANSSDDNGIAIEIFEDESELPIAANIWTNVKFMIISHFKSAKFRKFAEKLIVTILIIVCVKFVYGFLPISEIKETEKMFIAVLKIMEILGMYV